MTGEVKEIRYPDGSIYLGNMNNNQSRHGTGVLITVTVLDIGGVYYQRGIYESEWKDDKINGSSIIHWSAGGKYHGNFRNGRQHGHGEHTFADGRKYEGEYKDNNFHGHGVYTWPDGRKYDGQFEDGE